MRTLIFSDVHANLTALNAVLKDAEPFDAVWCLGDIVGYGPDPNTCIEKIQSLPKLKCVKGNHDAAILGDIDTRAFNVEARISLEWLKKELKTENRHWLAGLEDRLDFDDITIAHGSPRNPIWEYIMDIPTALVNLPTFDSKVCLVGHTHIPCIFQKEHEDSEMVRLYSLEHGESFSIKRKAIVNPGSVGQPRDHNPKASYLIYDDEIKEWCLHRIAYEIEEVQQRILAAGLPPRHASRLSEGW